MKSSYTRCFCGHNLYSRVMVFLPAFTYIFFFLPIIFVLNFLMHVKEVNMFILFTIMK